jgi:2-C-methyl-D-erythritol 2,4-cyclodiphosphate synthase
VIRIGHGFDAHRLERGRRLILGGIVVPFESGPAGHSDGDVLAHALSDALLGACALGDLGRYFPSSDARWKDADSLELLSECVAKVRAAGYEIANVDASVVVERPRLGPHLDAIRARLAEVLGVGIGEVSVKAKSTDGMGFTGDGTGIAAHAVALVRRSGQA